MTEPVSDQVDVNGEPCRVWRKGNGDRIGFLAGFSGMPKWIPFLDRLAEKYEVVVPSIPGYPGADGFRKLDTHVDWLVAVRELLEGAGLDENAILVGSGPGASFAAEMAALWPNAVQRLALIAPWGTYDEKAPMTDPWAQTPASVAEIMVENPDLWNELRTTPEGANSVEFPIEQTRVLEASARAFWPLGDTGLVKRLRRIACPTLLIWGDKDKVLPPANAKTFEREIGGDTKLVTIAGAGHLAELDKPDETAQAIIDFIG